MDIENTYERLLSMSIIYPKYRRGCRKIHHLPFKNLKHIEPKKATPKFPILSEPVKKA